jgi:transcriptional regulator with GAF, ATPase, and Fis domain
MLPLVRQSTTQQPGTTASLEAIPRLDGTLDSAGGLVLVYSRLHARLPSAVPLLADTITVGREPDNGLAIPEAAVSRLHARLEPVQGGWCIKDAGSTNGTFVNGNRVTEHLLRDHDLVRVGDTLFRYASRGIMGYAAHRIDGSVILPARVAKHQLKSALVGGHQIDMLLDRVDKVARTPLACVIQGESGTGKELLARTIHDASERKGALQAINCAALPANLIESELFGYKKGAFTGATQDKPGLVKAAHLGTLFLDEIGDMPLEAQAKLLRVLQERELLPIGATAAEKVDVRVVCATHRNLESLVVEGKFRGDLLARLREFAVRIPPLRERREDLYPLTIHFLRRLGRPDVAVSLPFVLGLAHYDWPYNVRELESCIKLAVALADGAELDVKHLPDTVQRVLRETQARAEALAPAARASVQSVESPLRSHEIGSAPGVPLVPAVAPPRDVPRVLARGAAPTEQELRAILARHRGNIAAVGRELGKERMQIHRWLKRYGIVIDEFRS